ncbi:MAG TPA: glycosyltransferase family 4 protein [Flavisolibacter sp.]|nr:glycosyltransferase family 4 protein [Flavisolibacter sp.]
MALNNCSTRILFFIGSLSAGGKERRLIELLTYLKSKRNFDLMVVVMKDEVDFPYFYKLNIPFVVIRKSNFLSVLPVIFKFYRICKKFKPHLIHTWGRMQSFYALPSVIGQKIPLINSQITGAPPKFNRWSIPSVIDRINFLFSKVILSNSYAGINSYKPPAGKVKVIYNGLNMSRFSNLPSAVEIKARYKIHTPYAVVMVANFSPNKNYKLFFKVAEKVLAIRNDVSFIGVGACDSDDVLSISKKSANARFLGRINDVEAFVNACDIGVLFSTNGEGISNSILEYMALGKPVIASAVGGNMELIRHEKNGFLIEQEAEDKIADLILELLKDEERINSFGRESKMIIDQTFTLDKMGKEFELVYEGIQAKYRKKNSI